MLYKLHKLWAGSAHSGTKPKSYIFLTRPNPIQEHILRQRGVVPIVSAEDNPQTGVHQLLLEVHKQLNIVTK